MIAGRARAPVPASALARVPVLAVRSFAFPRPFPRPFSLALSLLLAVGACASDRTVDAGLECLLLRDNGSAVLGMDSASSVPLDEEHSLWLFGETVTGRFAPTGHRIPSGAVENSGAVLPDDAGGRCFPGATFVGGAAPARVVAPPPDAPAEHRVQPRGGHFADGRLTVPFALVRAGEGEPPGLTVVGSGLARGAARPPDCVGCPLDEAPRAVADRPLAPASEPPPAALLVHDGYAYLYRCGPAALLGRPGVFPCVVGRASSDAIDDLAAYRYLAPGRGFDGDLAEASVALEGAPQLSVRWSGRLGRFLAVDIAPSSGQVSARTAPAPEGPFTERVALAACTLPAGDEGAYCHGAVEHAALAREDDRLLTITYATGSTTRDAIVRHPDLYWPRLLRVELPPSLR